jgi:hypothetical protein
MMRFVIPALLGSAFIAGGVTESARAQQTTRSERAEHSRIAAAIRELEDAIRYMERAPHDFDAYKAEALQSSRQALHDLRLALAYRARQDNMR